MAYKRVPHDACASCGKPFIGIVDQQYCDRACWRKAMPETFRTKKRPGVLRRWTEADLAIAYARALDGVPVRQLAEEANVNQGSLGRLLKDRFDYVPTPYRRRTLAIPENVAVRAYMAGLIDGEGSIPFLNAHWCVKIAMTDEPVIRWLHQFGGRMEVQDQRQVKLDGSPKKTVYGWNVHRRHDVIHLLGAILPYLIVKRDRAQQVLAAIQL